MDQREAGRLWDENADVWTALSRAGHDVYRDAFNTPAFLEMLPDVAGQRGIDIGCGEGTNTRSVAALGARMSAIDVSPRFIRHAAHTERESPAGIGYAVASALKLPFADETFAFATAFMSLMDVPDHARALREAHRVIEPGGFLQFSISHPCFDTPHRVNRRDDGGRTFAIEVGDYFRPMDGEIQEWIFSNAPPEARATVRPFRVARFNRTLSEWLNAVVDAGFEIERTAEPRPTRDALERWPAVRDATVVAYFLHLRARKPGP